MVEIYRNIARWFFVGNFPSLRGSERRGNPDVELAPKRGKIKVM